MRQLILSMVAAALIWPANAQTDREKTITYTTASVKSSKSVEAITEHLVATGILTMLQAAPVMRACSKVAEMGQAIRQVINFGSEASWDADRQKIRKIIDSFNSSTFPLRIPVVHNASADIVIDKANADLDLLVSIK